MFCSFIGSVPPSGIIPGCGREVYKADDILLYRIDIADIVPNRE